MSVRTPQSNNVAAKTFPIKNVTPITTWVRNPSWSALPSVLASDEKFVGLYAVMPDSPFAAVNFAVAGGATQYYVDWGDGTNDTVNSGVQINHLYDFTNAALANTNGPVTFTASTSTVNRTAHGYTDGMALTFASITTTTGISVSTTYYVVNSTANTFQVSLTSGGSAVTLTNDGSGALLLYKQAIVTITPATTGTITTVNIGVRNTTSQLQPGCANGWLDIKLAASCTTLKLSDSSAVYPKLLEQVNILRHSATNWSYLLYFATNLQSFSTSSTSAVTDFSYAFNSCGSLQTIPLFDTSAATTTSNMFNGCASLRYAPAFNLSGLTNTCTYMFGNCYNLQEAPALTFRTATGGFIADNMFSTCYSLQSVPFYDLSHCTSAASMFSSCYNLRAVPKFDLVNCGSTSGMFSTCISLQYHPGFTSSVLTNCSSMFSTCYSLVGVGPIDVSQTNVNTVSVMFNNCYSLQSVPLFKTTAVTAFSNMFSGCYSLKSVPLYDTSSGQNFSQMFTNCISLTSIPAFNTAAATNMSTMFQNCYNLRSVPLLTTNLVTNFSSMFYNCIQLTTVPQFNTVAGTNFSSMFQGCANLVSVPAFNTAAASSMSSMFGSCSNLQTVGITSANGATSTSTYTSMFSGCVSLANIDTVNFKYTFTVANCKLSQPALDKLYTNLATVTGQTITVSQNWGTATDTISIATGKGWTVTG